MLKFANNGAVQSNYQNLSVVVDGWEKAKMKKKHSGIKPDISPSGVSTIPTDSHRGANQGIQQRTVTNIRSRLSSESHGFRPGVSNGTVGCGKSDGISQSTGLSMLSSIPRTDMDSGSLLSDRRECPIGSDKERVNFRAVNKENVHGDFSSVSPASSAKMNASMRAPRSGSSVTSKWSPVVHTATNDWELSHSTNKPSALGANSQKRTTSAQSSSPPVARWASQRPQKISRIARRTNLIPIASNNDGNPALGSVSDISGNEIGPGFARHLSGTSPQQAEPKNGPLSSAALSESEESRLPEIGSKDKGKKSDELDEKAGQNVQKASTLGLPSRKNELVTGEDIGDGVPTQGRSGRGSTSTRSLMPMTAEKLGNAGTSKQLGSSRIDKNGGKSGHPPTRKLSDRKAYSRQKHLTVNAAADFLVGSHDQMEELLAAANAVINPAHAFSSSFWRQMERFFGLLSDRDIAYLKQQLDMQIEDDIICGEISNLEEKYGGQVLKKKVLLYKLMNSALEAKDRQAHEFERRAYDQLIMVAYKKYTIRRSHSAAGGKGSSNKMAKQATLAFVKCVLEHCHKFEDTGKSCFSEPLFKDMFLSAVSQQSGAQWVDSNGDSELLKLYSCTSRYSLEGRVLASTGSQTSPLTSYLGQNGEHYINTFGALHPGNRSTEQNYGKEDIWLNRVMKRELLLDYVSAAGTSGAHAPSGFVGSLPSSTKGKRREREREGKGHNRDVLPRHRANKVGRPVTSVKGERKSKAKPKQKAAQLSVSGNGLVGKISEKPKSTLPSESKSSEMTTNSNAKDGFGFDVEAIDLSSLPGIDGLDGQGQDLASWLSIDDDGLQDHEDFMGLEIPMDDLTDLNMMV